MARGEHDVPAGAVVRVRGTDGQVVGGGFLVGPGVLATCAHVVADAVGADAYDPAAPTAPVRLDFPLLDGPDGGPPQARGSVERWVPIADDGTGDIALLRLDGPLPEHARMPPLRRVERLWGHGFRVLGFPDGAWDGVWTTGQIRGEQGTGWFQLQSTVGEQPVEGGFSGTPVWHDGSGAVVGMTVAADRGGTTTAYLVPIDLVLGVDPELLPSPYRGLAPFGEEHADLFFGRDPDVERLVDAVDRNRVVAVAGPSGAGKSSLVRAGLLPRLRARGLHIAEVAVAPGTAPEVPEAFPAPTVLVVDQFEELAALDPPAARALLQELVAMADPAAGADVRVVLTVRWSALDDLLTPDLAAVLEAGTVLVAPLDRARLREAIVGPAERAPGLAFEDGLVDRILDDAGSEPGQLPLVGSLLAALWERRDGGYLTLAGYAAAGGVAGSVARHADQVVAAMDADEDDLRRLFTRLARPDRDGRFVRHPVALADLPEPLARLVPPLAAGRLLVVGRSAPAGGDTVELAHQALVEHWPRLRDWLVADREFLAWRAALDVQRERWEATGRDHGALLRGAALAATGEWLPARSADLSAANRAYLQRSTQRQRREVRRWRAVTAVLAVLVLAAGGLAVVVTQRGNALAAQLATANADVLARESVARATTDAALSAQLALAAWRSDPRSPQARTALAGAYLAMRSVESVHPEAAGTDVDVLRTAGDTAVLLRRDAGPLLLTGLRDGAFVPWEPPDVTAATPTDVSPDGRTLVALGPDGDVRVWDVATRRVVRTMPVDGRLLAIAFGPAGDRVGWLTDTGTAGALEFVLADPATGRRLPHGLGPVPSAGLTAFWLTPDGTGVLLRYGPSEIRLRDDAGPDDRVVLRSLADGTETTRLPPDVRVVRGGAALLSCAVAPDARGLNRVAVTVTPVGPGGAPLTVTSILAGDCQNLRLTPDGELLLESGGGGQDSDQEQVWATDLTDGRTYQLAMPRAAEPAPVGAGGRIRGERTVGVIRAPGRPPRVLVVHGPALLVLRGDLLPVRPPPGVARQRAATDDGRFVLQRSGETFAVSDARTGEVLGSRTFVRGPGGVNWMLAEALWMLHDDTGRWRLTRYELPTLAEGYTIEPPAGNPQRAGWFPAFGADDDGAIVILNEGLLTAWDRDTGQPVGGPTDVGSTPTMEIFDSRVEVGWARPGHDDQMAFLTPQLQVQVWDAGTGERLVTVPTSADEPGDVRFDDEGRRMAVLTAARAIEIWDVDSATLVRPPIPATQVGELIGFDADGYLVVRLADLQTVELIDVDGGFVSGSLGLPDTPEEGLRAGRTVSASASAASGLPPEYAVTADGWFAGLCAGADRPFTAAERALLPPGVDTDPPCH